MTQTRLPLAYTSDTVRILELNFRELLDRLGTLETSVSRGAIVIASPLTSDALLLEGNDIPERATQGSTPAVEGFLFNDTSSRVTFTFRVPQNWKADARDKRMTIRLWCHLTGSETNGDSIEWVADYVTVRASNSSFANGSGGNATGTSTQITAATSVVSGALNAGDVYIVTFTLDPDDANNGWDARDGYAIYLSIGRSSVGGSGKVGDVLLTGADLIYQASNKGG